MDLTVWSPFKDLEDFFDRYSRGALGPKMSLLGENAEWRPAATIVENDNEYVIKADLPEVKRDDIAVDIEKGVLSIRGERRIEKTSENEKQHRREAFYGKFSRSFALPEDAAVDQVRAEHKDGVLRVHIPKTVAKAPQSVSVKVG